MPSGWSETDIPDQSDRTALVTGANSGLGLRTSEALARAGADVILACRDPERGRRALEAVSGQGGSGTVELLELDLADLGSIRAAAEEVGARERPLDLLVNNAGVMAPPRRETADGFELQFGTNHLGHFALTGLVLDRLLAAPAPRVVTLSSLAHRAGRMDFDDLDWQRRYSRWPAYGRSKLANLLFAFELARRARSANSRLSSIAAHPGYSGTNLQSSGPGMGVPLLGPLVKVVASASNAVLAQSDRQGALPTLYAATSPDAENGDYIGPSGPGEWRGSPDQVGSSGRANDIPDAERLWAVSEERTGVRFGPLT
jgi:NAD(P)-dependent dehydrogenase (short-subunit alcohol dehydrogenase family)